MVNDRSRSGIQVSCPPEFSTTNCKPVPYFMDTILISMNSKREENSHELSTFVLRMQVQRSFFKHRKNITQARRSGIKHTMSWKFFNLRFRL